MVQVMFHPSDALKLASGAEDGLVCFYDLGRQTLVPPFLYLCPFMCIENHESSKMYLMVGRSPCHTCARKCDFRVHCGLVSLLLMLVDGQAWVSGMRRC
jgi:hypothetical protein